MAGPAGDVATELEDDGSRLWRVLADPTRRRILDLLRAQPRITGEIASNFKVSRIAVMRHLAVLSEAGLVTSRKRGRQRWFYLNAVPLQHIHERWVSSQMEVWASGLLRLRRSAKGAASRMNASRPAVDVAFDISIAAPPVDVFAAITEDPGGWWGHPYMHAGTTSLTLEPRLGGLLTERWRSGGAVLATVTNWTDDRHLELTGPFHLGLAVGIAAFELSPSKRGTNLHFTFRAFGAIEEQMIDRFAQGWRELVGQRLKTLVETGTRLGIAPDPPR